MRALRWVAILYWLMPVAASDLHSRVNLGEILQNPALLHRMSLMWEYPPNVALYVYGDGRLILQAYPVIPDDPDNPIAMTRRNGLVPTCKNKIASDDVSALIRWMIEKHFFDLPDKSFAYNTAALQRRKLELHTIAVDSGKERAARTFAVGKYGDQDESLPANFVALEDALAKMRDSAFPPAQRPCGVAPGIKFGSETSD